MTGSEAARTTAGTAAPATPRFDLAAEAAGGPLEVVVATVAPRPVDPADLALLSAAERERAAAFRRPEDAARFVTGRRVARRLLADRLGTAPVDVDLVVPRPGWKPRVPGTTLDVSIAHAGAVVLVAIADGAEVGVDVERAEVATTLDPELWRGATSAAERDALGTLAWPAGTTDAAAVDPGTARPAPDPTAVDAFLRVWVRKEAVLKALRVGLAVPMDALTVRDADPPAVLELPPGPVAAGDVTLLDLGAPVGHRAALAVLTRRPVVVVDAATGARVGSASSDAGG